MHLQGGEGVAKLVRCARGRIYDVAVDVRAGSPTYGRWEGVELDEESMRELYVPVGFAHGFCVLSEIADVIYKQSAYYDQQLERGIAYDDPEIGIAWPLEAAELTVSERGAAAPALQAGARMARRPAAAGRRGPGGARWIHGQRGPGLRLGDGPLRALDADPARRRGAAVAGLPRAGRRARRSRGGAGSGDD